MSTFSDELHQSIKKLMTTAWDESTSETVPRTSDVKMADGAFRVEAAYLYADLAESTLLQKTYKDTFAARVLRMYLNGACQIIREGGGTIKSTNSMQWTVKHGVGIDAGEAFVTRAGVRNSSGETTHNDLISVGRSPNVAAKLSADRDLRKGPTIITAEVHSYLNHKQLYAADGRSMWTGPHHADVGPYKNMDLYASTFWRRP